MIQALRDLIDLYTFYFDILERFLDGLLDLLCVCICQGKFTTLTPRLRKTQYIFQKMTLLPESALRVCNNFWKTMSANSVRRVGSELPRHLFAFSERQRHTNSLMRAFV